MNDDARFALSMLVIAAFCISAAALSGGCLQRITTVVSYDPNESGALITFKGSETPAPVQTTLPATRAIVPPTTIGTPVPTQTQRRQYQSLSLTAPAYSATKDLMMITAYDTRLYPNYTWYSTSNGQFYLETPPYKNQQYLFVFVYIENKGKSRMWIPGDNQFVVSYLGQTMPFDKAHEKGVLIKELMHKPARNNVVYVTDYNWRNLPAKRNETSSKWITGAIEGWCYPGSSNAIDGYLIYTVPKDIDLAETYLIVNFYETSKMWNLKKQG